MTAICNFIEGNVLFIWLLMYNFQESQRVTKHDMNKTL